MPYCSHLDNSLNINIKGKIRPCYRHDKLYDEPSYQKDLIDLKQLMSSGWSKYCNRCRNEENAGIKSLRQQHIEEKYISITHNNTCNMMCLICDHHHSSQWSKMLNKPISKYELSAYLKYITKDTTMIKYVGGEPFLSKDLIKLFTYLDNENIIQNIIFKTHTNGSIFPNKTIIYFLKKFKNVDIGISVDSVGEDFSTFRYGKTTSWDKVYTNIKKWFEHFDNCHVAITVSALNITTLMDTKKFFNDKGIKTEEHLLHVPDVLSINSIHPDVFNNIIIDDVYKKFYKYNEKYDQLQELIAKYKNITHRQML